MTYEDFKKIYEDLAAWRAERRLTVESQREGLIGNILEELAEVARAKNNDEKVGEICDIAVFAINAMDEIPSEEDFDCRTAIGTSRVDGGAKDIVYPLKMITEDDLTFRADEGANYFIAGIVIVCSRVIKTLGYDPAAAMSQTLQKINSRRGAYDETLKKWVKDTSDEARAQWFTPNYALCRVEKI